jgi:hypothetical protein
MENEHVKVKMQLRATRPSIQGAAPAGPAAQAAVEAVEARWRAEDKKIKSENRKKRFVGCLSWLFLLLVAAGAAWYFLGEKYLPPQYTFPRIREVVMETILGWLNPPPIGSPRPQPQPKEDLEPVKLVDPADSQTAAVRSSINTFVNQLEMICRTELEKAQEVSPVQLDAWPVGRGMLNEILSADRWYFKAREKLSEMEDQNEKLQKLRMEETAARRRKYAAQYRPELINRQRNEVERKLADCKRIRAQVVQRAGKAVKVASSQWTGPESRRDAAQLLKRLDELAKKFKDKK